MKLNIFIRSIKMTDCFFLLSIIFLSISCNKADEWLDKKRNKSDVVPTSLKDFQAILDNDMRLNRQSPTLGMIGIDNYYVPYATWQSLSPIERSAYTWEPDIFHGGSNADWNFCYQVVEYANIVLDGLKKITADASIQNEFNTAKGSALFFRAKAFYDLASLFSKQYDASTALTDLGIPLRLNSDVNEKSVRASLKQTYDQVINDLTEAESLLPVTPLYQTRPSKPAAEALLARIYLDMGDYVNAENYAAAALSHFNTLVDYNTFTGQFPFPVFPQNTEVIFYSTGASYAIIEQNWNAIVDSVLYKSYDANDLRKERFYYNNGGRYLFTGSYAGSPGLFSGIATNEILLIRAEAYARNNKVNEAMTDLNGLLIKRWKTGTFVPFSATSAEDALRTILIERRKELAFTVSLRWNDLKRLNKDARFAVTLKRDINGQVYTLAPNDNKYVYPIPEDEIALSGLQQNPR